MKSKVEWSKMKWSGVTVCYLPTDGQLPTCCLPVPGVEWYKAWRIPPQKAKLTLVGWGAPS